MRRSIRHILLVVVFHFFIVSCVEGPSLSIVGSKSFDFTNQGGSQTIVFSANRDWRVVPSEPWCQVSPSSGFAKDGELTISLSVPPNPGYDPRSANVVIIAEELSESVSVYQEAGNGLIVSPKSFNLSNKAQEIEVDVQKNINYSVVISNSGKDWVKWSGTRALSNEKVSFTVSENTTYEKRECEIIFRQVDGSLSETLVVRQEEAEGLFVENTSYTISEDGGVLSLAVKSNVDYEVNSEVEWIDKIETRALKSSEILLSVAANASTFGRTGQVILRQCGGNLTQTVSVFQQARPALTSLNPTDIGLFTATFHGNLVVDTASEITDQVWFVYSSENSSLEDLMSNGVKVIASLGDDGGFFKEIVGLSLATEYHYVACATVNGREYYGEIKSFKTLDYDASVTTLPASEITYDSCVINGDLNTYNADLFSKSVWFLYGQSQSSLDDLITSGIRVPASLAEDGSFKVSLSGLSYGTEYNFVACARVNDRNYFGEVGVFSTESFSASVITRVASDVTLYKGVLNGSVSFDNIASFSKSVRFLYSDTAETLEELIGQGIEEVSSVDIDGDFSVNLTGLKCGTEYHFVACATVNDIEFYGEVSSFFTSKLPEGAVDLGLSVAWASCNVGAESPERFGDYYAWGETEKKDSYDWNTYLWGNGESRSLIKYNYDRYYGLIDNKFQLDTDDDVAQVKMGGSWRMPTKDEMAELVDNCDWVFQKYKGVNGFTVRSKVNGNCIFLPISGRAEGDFVWLSGSWGCYLTSSLNSPTSAFCLEIDEIRSNPYLLRSNSRYLGLSVRAVIE